MFCCSGVTGTGTMVTDGFPLVLVSFQDTSLVAVALLYHGGGIVLIHGFVLCLVSVYKVVPLHDCVSAVSIDTSVV